MKQEKTTDILKRVVRDGMFKRLCVYLALLLVCAVLVSIKTLDRHTVQMIYLVGAVFLILFLRLLLKLLRRYFGTSAGAFFKKLSKRLTSALSSADRRLRRLLHLPPRRYIYEGEDERVYGYNLTREEKKERRRAQSAKLKWKNLDENKLKIRFLYVKYVSAAISEGYGFRYSHTPRRIKADIAKDEKQRLLYDLYEDVRYKKACGDIDDEVIEYLNEK